jgi:hypothetical protein
MKENTLRAWEIEANPDLLQEVINFIRLDAKADTQLYLESAKVDLGGE